MTLLLLAELLQCDPSIRTLDDNYIFGDSIEFTITNPCEAPIDYYIALERWDTHHRRWHLVDVDVFTSYPYIGPLRTVSPGHSSFVNRRREYGEHFLSSHYRPDGRFRYRLEIYKANAHEVIYSNEFTIKSG